MGHLMGTAMHDLEALAVLAAAFVAAAGSYRLLEWALSAL